MPRTNPNLVVFTPINGWRMLRLIPRMGPRMLFFRPIRVSRMPRLKPIFWPKIEPISGRPPSPPAAGGGPYDGGFRMGWDVRP